MRREPIKWNDRCPRCGKRMTPEGWARREGYICTRCKEEACNGKFASPPYSYTGSTAAGSGGEPES